MVVGAGPNVLPLSDPDASSPTLAGSKAANIARACAAGLPTVPGYVLTVAGVERGVDAPEVVRDLRANWTELGGEAGAPMVVRSSSTIEDIGSSSMAGRFTSVLDVVGWEQLLAAVRKVVASADAVRDADGAAQPMAVLVQRQLDARLGGVLFGVDPVTGDRDHVVVEAVSARPDVLVSGEVTADHVVLSRRGRVVERAAAAPAVALSRSLRRRLAELATRTEELFGTPQDVEWAVDQHEQLWLLQSRPVTAVAEARPQRSVPLLGPGPVAETFPYPLRRLETDLWIEPLRQGIVRALRSVGAASERAIARSPVVTTVGGWPAADLELLGITSPNVRSWRHWTPAAIGRRVIRAWRVGRLRVALPRLVASVVATVDRDLGAIPRLARHDDVELVEMLERARRELATVHLYEVLAGMLLRPRPDAPPTSIIAVHALRDGRAMCLTDDEIVARTPVVLALVPPSLVPTGALPAAGDTDPAEIAEPLDALDERDALRLRTRWLQELMARVAQALGDRLHRRGLIDAPEMVGELGLEELAEVVRGGGIPADLARRAGQTAGPALPAAFRLDAGGHVHAVRSGTHPRGAGLPASAGRAIGEARHHIAPGEERPGLILVTRHLEPHLAPLLAGLAGLVAETGSSLSHLAILAREQGVPAVVGVEDALQRFPPGTRLMIDGSTGEVVVVDDRDQEVRR